MLERYGVFAIAAALSMVFLALDLILPLGIAGGVLYVAVVLFGLWFPDRRQIIFITLLSILLIIIGYHYSPVGGILWKVHFNRGLALFAVIATGSVVYIAKKAAERHDGHKDKTLMQVSRLDKLKKEHGPYDPVSSVGYRGILIAFPILLIVIGVTIWANQKSAEEQNRVTNSHQVQHAITHILSILQDAETGQRGFLLTGKENYLEPFNQATSQIENTVTELQGLVADSPEQLRRIDQAVLLMDKKIAEINRTIMLRRSIGLKAAMEVVQSNRGKEIMDQLRGIVSEMMVAERRLLDVRVQAKKEVERFTQIATLIGIALLILIAAIVIIKIQKLIALRIRDEETLLSAHAQLETRVEERTQNLQKEIEAREKAETLNMRFGRIIEQSLSEIFIFDAQNLIFILANNGARANLGYTTEELQKMTPVDIKPKINHKMFDKIIEPLLNGLKEIVTFETTHLRKDGSTYDAEIHLQLMQNETPAVFVAHVQDITERKAADNAIITSKEEAELANRAKSEFLANMSHELRTPLNAIIGFSDMLIHKTFGPLGASKNLESASAINESGKHLMKIIGDILDISKIEAGEATVTDTKVAIVKTVSDCNDMMATRVQEAKVNLQVEIPDHFPDLRADERQVKQILINLLNNAIKFTHAGGQITISAHVKDSCIELSVNDTGIGIATDDIKRVMQPFGQVAANSTSNYGGTGLGLPICNSLMKLHDGNLSIDSEPGKGTTVTIKFPPERTIQL